MTVRGPDLAPFRRACHICTPATEPTNPTSPLRRLTRLSGPGSDSPPETSLRLLLQPLIREFNSDLLPQLPILRDGSVGGESCQDLPPGRCLTVIDLAGSVHRFAFFHDGQDHLNRRPRDRDARITAELIALGRLPVRVSAGMPRDPVGLRNRVRGLYLQRTQ